MDMNSTERSKPPSVTTVMIEMTVMRMLTKTVSTLLIRDILKWQLGILLSNIMNRRLLNLYSTNENQILMNGKNI